MAIFKCKMCGGDLEIGEDITVLECEYCGTKQTIPVADNEKKLNLFNRANRLRINGEFDKAVAIYENIVAEFPEEAEAYWGLVICNYGIEYVDDPATGKKIPTCHRASFTPIANDENYKMALEYADVSAQKVYRDEAREIDRIREEILAVSKNEKPYDIFICYKETDEQGQRTVDSVLAQDVYDALTEKGYRVFFARISLEDKLGRQYEPYIFAALNSAKIMLSIGTKYEYFHAVWVKNEWSRFLKLAAKDKTKVLIPCYKDMDAYDMPDEFKALQAQDLGKVGAIQDLIRGIKKILDEGEPAVKENSNQPSQNPTITSLLKRAFMYLEDGEWRNADQYCEKVLDIDPENPEAYIGKYMASSKIKNREEIYKCPSPLPENSLFAKAVRFSPAGSFDAYVVKNQEYLEELAELEKQKELRKKQEQEETEKLLVGKRVLASKLEHTLSVSLNGIIALNEKGKLIATSNISAKTIQNMNRKCFIGLYGNQYALTADGFIYNIDYPYTFELVGRYDNVSYFHWSASYAPVLVVANGKIGVVKSKGLDATVLDQIGNWDHIVKVACGKVNDNYFVVALTEEGTLLISGKITSKLRAVEDWTDIIDFSVEDDDIVGLKKDGTVVAAGGNEHGELNVSDWTDVVTVLTDALSTIGLRKGGTVLTVGSNESGELNLSNWTNMLTIYTHYDTTYGLRSDGKVLVAGKGNYSTRALQNQTDVVGLSRSDYCTTVIFSDGTARCFPDDEEYHSSAKLNVSEFKLFENMDTLVLPMDNEEFKKIGELAASKREVVDLKQRNKELQAYKELFACNNTHTVGLKADGTVLAAGEQGKYKFGACNVSEWKNVKKVYTVHNMSVGVTQNGNVVYTGFNSSTQGISKWKNVEKLAFGKDLVAALKRDGTACAEGSLYDYSSVSKWTGLVDIACSMYGVYGLKADGTVVYSAGTGIADVKNWTDITAIACGGNHVVGLKSDGTVVAAGSNSEGQCNVSSWKNVMAIYTTTNERDDIYSTKTFALTFDGRLLSTYQYIHSDRNNIVDITAYQSDLVAILADGSITWVSGGRYDVYNPTDWYDIVTVCMGHMSVLGLRRDGSVVYAYKSKYYEHGNCSVDGWEILPGTAESAKQQAEQEAVEEVKSWKRQGRCQHCGGELKGLFSKKCTSCKREKDY